MTTYTKKLIEVSIPLKEINEASAREKSIRHGHPSTLHLWWARRPLAAARAVIFCQLVDDPGGYVDELLADKVKRQKAQVEVDMELKMTPHASPNLEEMLVEKERERLHDIVKELVIWENTTNEKVLNKARKEIKKSWQRTCRREGKPEDTPMPPLLDPFAGGGAIPLEAQRLGLEAHASDLNPVAVLINKAMIEIPPKFAGLPPVNPEWQSKTKEEKAATTWSGAQGLADDVRYYGNWMRDEAKKRIGHLYPPYTLTQELIDSRPDLQKAGYKDGDELTVIAWLWARTVPSPNPALGGKHVPLVSSFWLSKKKGREAYVEPVVEDGDYRFEVRIGMPEDVERIGAGTKTGRGANFHCIFSHVPIASSYIRLEARKNRMNAKLLAVVASGKRGRVYLNATKDQEESSKNIEPIWKPEQLVPTQCHDVDRLPMYGMPTWGDAFTDRQANSIATFAELVEMGRDQVFSAGEKSLNFDLDGMAFSKRLESGGRSCAAYADALAVYLALAVSRLTDSSSSLASWTPQRDTIRSTFGRHALPMVWDFAEVNILSDSAGNFGSMINWIQKVIERFPAFGQAEVIQANAAKRKIPTEAILSTDPPYYDNIGYAELSDFFYVWIRKSLRFAFPDGTKEILVPKAEEMIAAVHRHGGKAKAESFFLNAMTNVAEVWARSVSSLYPMTIYYAFKQTEIRKDGISSTGWATFLGALMNAGLTVVGTWPVRTERVGKITASSNVLASSIVLVCRQRPKNAETITKREFIEALETELPLALRELQHANLSPVDLPQSAIGPGIAIYSRHAFVIKGDGSPMSVTEALQLINHELSTILDGQVSDMDNWTRFACKWFEQHAFSVGSYGDAETIANGIDVSVTGVVESGIAESGHGRVRILRPAELPDDWNPVTDPNCTVWEIVHHLLRVAEGGGDKDCAAILAQLTHGKAAEARQLCYRLYTLCENNGWSKEAQGYNQLITNWTEYADLAENLEKNESLPEQVDMEYK